MPFGAKKKRLHMEALLVSSKLAVTISCRQALQLEQEQQGGQQAGRVPPTAADVHHAATTKLRVQPHVIISRGRWIGLHHPRRRVPHVVRQRLDAHVLDGADDSTADHVARGGGGVGGGDGGDDPRGRAGGV